MVVNKPERKPSWEAMFKDLFVGEGFRWKNWYYIKEV